MTDPPEYDKEYTKCISSVYVKKFEEAQDEEIVFETDETSVVTENTETTLNGVRNGHSMPTVEDVRLEGGKSVADNAKSIKTINTFRERYEREEMEGEKFRQSVHRRVLGCLVVTMLVLLFASVTLFVTKSSDGSITSSGGSSNSTGDGVKPSLDPQSQSTPIVPNSTTSGTPVTKPVDPAAVPPTVTPIPTLVAPKPSRTSDTVGDDGKTSSTSGNGSVLTEEMKRLETLVYFVTQYKRISTLSTLENPGSPQFSAAMNMVNDDTHGIPNEDSEPWIIKPFLERYIMTVFYFSLGGSYWLDQSNFLTPQTSVCDWNYYKYDIELGVKCNGYNSVTHIVMPANNLIGTIPFEISHLESLEHISLSGNEIRSIHPILSQTLSFLQLGSNEMDGEIPHWITGLTNLQYLGLNDNKFIGTIPAKFHELKTLREIDISNNQLTGTFDMFDKVPCSSNLTLLYTHHNMLTGRLQEDSFASCLRLIDIDLSYNNITGVVPDHIYNMYRVSLQDNQLSGPISEVRIVDSPIQYMNLGGNNLTGPIPKAIFESLKELKHIDLSKNSLTGSLSDIFNDMALLDQLEYLNLNQNLFEEGPIPDLSNAIRLKELFLSETNRTGPIPSWIGKLTDLKLLDLHRNKLNGSIPNELGQLFHLEFLFLNRNMLSGDIPSSLRNLEDSIQFFFLDKNSLSGTVPLCSDSNGTTTSSLATATMFSVMQVEAPQVRETIVADCLGSPSKVVCDCCRTCCSDANENCNDGPVEHHYLDLLSPTAPEHSINNSSYLYRENEPTRESTRDV